MEGHSAQTALRGSEVPSGRAQRHHFVADQGSAIGKLEEENRELKRNLELRTREFEAVQAVARENEGETEQLGAEVGRSGGRNRNLVQTPLAVAILDFETDLFSPIILNSTNPGQTAARRIRARMLELLPRNEAVQILVYLFFSPDSKVTERLIETGVVRNQAEINQFIDDFTGADPLFIVVTDKAWQERRERQRALASLYAGNTAVQLVLLGRWGFESALVEALAPTSQGPAIPDKVKFIEPLIGFVLPPELSRKKLQVVGMSGIFRRYHLPETRINSLELDSTRPFWKQTSPICLDFHLDHCSEERCPFSHSYRINQPTLSSLRHEASRIPRPLLAIGEECLDSKNCYFSHDLKSFSVQAPSRPQITIPGYRLSTIAPPRRPLVPSPPLQPIHRPNSVPTRRPSQSPVDPSPLSARHPLSPIDPLVSTRPDRLTDGQLRELLAKTKREEEEYERDLREDPFFRARQA